jgi:hypothetical protein
MRSSVTARFGADRSSVSPICFWFTSGLDATSIRIENSTTFRSSGPKWRAKTRRIAIAARLAA